MGARGGGSSHEAKEVLEVPDLGLAQPALLDAKEGDAQVLDVALQGMHLASVLNRVNLLPSQLPRRQ